MQKTYQTPGGVQNGTPQRIVAMHMVDDLHATTAAFFYHLGDVVYYNGEASGYYAQFYDLYLNYDAPIFAMPGNHDGDLNNGERLWEKLMVVYKKLGQSYS
jgi:acid phosphatase type 7